MFANTLFAALAAMAVAVPAAAHMQIVDPPPLRSQFNPNTVTPEYSMTSPLDGMGGDYPCKGFLTDVGTPGGAPVATWAPGSQASFTMGTGGAVHGGGSCQASFSIDGGKTFRVAKSFIGNCPTEGGKFDFTVPAGIPAGEAIFAWTWFNQIGNREMYMNCAVITIEGGGAAKREEHEYHNYTRRADSFDSLPEIFKANINNGCATVANFDVVFPDPGNDVVNDPAGKPTAPTGNCGGGGGGGGAAAPADGSAGATPPADASAGASDAAGAGAGTGAPSDAAVAPSDGAATPAPTSAAGGDAGSGAPAGGNDGMYTPGPGEAAYTGNAGATPTGAASNSAVGGANNLAAEPSAAGADSAGAGAGADATAAAPASASSSGKASKKCKRKVRRPRAHRRSYPIRLGRHH